MRTELDIAKELTGASEEQIRLHDDGYWSAAYVINDGELVVKFIRPQHKNATYSNEVKILNALEKLNPKIFVPRVKWISDDMRCVVLYGVRGTSLANIKNLTLDQKQNIGRQLGEFLMQLHKIEVSADKFTLEAELQDYKKIYKELSNFFDRYLLPKEKELLDNIMNVFLPTSRRNLGEVIVFSHADAFEPNILIDENDNVGLIDFGNAGYFEESADFGIDDDILRDLVLDHYKANETLRKKVGLKYDMSIICAAKYHIEKHGISAAAKKWIPLVKQVISKHKKLLKEM